MPKRILHVIPTLDRAGAEKQLLLLATGLPRDQFDVHVCALTRGGPLAAELQTAGIPVHVVGKHWKADPICFWRLKRHIARLRPEMVHTWMFTANAYGRAAALAAGVKHLVAAERCVDLWKSGYQFALDRRLARRTQRLIANSIGVRDFYVAHGLPADRFTVIPNGVPLTQPSPIARRQLLDELDIEGDVRLIGIVGRLWPQKRVSDLIWVAELIHILRQDVHVLIIGDGPARPSVKRYRRLMHAENYVHLLGHRNDVPAILPHLDLLWLGSQYEGMPNSIMEAMAAGVPVVATNIPGPRDLVVHGQTGFLAPVGGRAAFTRYTEQILNDAELARRLGEAGRQRMREHFAVEPMVHRHAELYTQMLG